MKKHQLVLTCEHASNRLPDPFKYLFGEDANEVLESHRGWDPGAIDLTRELAGRFGIEPFVYEYSRLLIEVNRSIGHEQLFSEYSSSLKKSVKKYLVDNYYKPYRKKVKKKIKEVISMGAQAVHISVHTFTPEYFGQRRAVEIGLLFDPERMTELEFCQRWKAALDSTSLDVRFNEPYRGIDDGFTTCLRERFARSDYLGIELEVSQKFNRDLSFVSEALKRSLGEILE